MRIAITPQETFFFRDARPFDKGSGWATGIFPPLPSTVYGALRSVAIARSSSSYAEYEAEKHDGVLREEMGTPKMLGSFAIRSVALHDGIGALVPLPLDLRKREADLIPLAKNINETIISDSDVADCSLYCPESANDDDVSPTAWLRPNALTLYLLGNSKLVARRASPDVEPVLTEPKAGIEKSGTGSVAKGMLYFQEMLRLNDGVHLSVDAEAGTTIGERGGLRMGHDGRLFAYRTSNNESNFGFLEETKDTFIKRLYENGKHFKMLFTTPAVLRRGWLPAGKDKEFTINGLSIRIMSAVIGRPMRVAGWDVVARRAKPMQKAVPAGSVYYAVLEKGEPEKLWEALFDKNITDADANLRQQGFGHVLLGLPTG